MTAALDANSRPLISTTRPDNTIGRQGSPATARSGQIRRAGRPRCPYPPASALGRTRTGVVAGRLSCCGIPSLPPSSGSRGRFHPSVSLEVLRLLDLTAYVTRRDLQGDRHRPGPRRSDPERCGGPMPGRASPGRAGSIPSPIGGTASDSLRCSAARRARRPPSPRSARPGCTSRRRVGPVR